VPHFTGGEQISILWLAYASGCYLGSRTNRLVEPVYWFGGRYFFNRRLELPADWVIAQFPPRLPARVVYFDDGFVRGADGTGAPRIVPYPKPYANGYTNAVYEVVSFLEVGPYKIPTAFRADDPSNET
jgi:hypothetical protein